MAYAASNFQNRSPSGRQVSEQPIFMRAETIAVTETSRAVNNIAALFTQGAAVTVIAMGLIFVLLIGEIDLSAGYTAGISAAVMTLMLPNR